MKQFIIQRLDQYQGKSGDRSCRLWRTRRFTRRQTDRCFPLQQDACTGTTVTMELGNGYQAVYGQLKDLTVAEGDTVKEGEVIGNISAPTKYYSVEGPNLYFAMRKDGTPVDPFEYLE